IKSFSQLINQKAPTHMPVQEAGGTGYLTSLDGAIKIGIWLPLFPGRYVGLSFGTNDALGCVDPTAFYNNYEVMVQAVLAAGKLPIVPHIPWGKEPLIQKCAPALNGKIDMLYQKYPKIIKGPDFWTYFQKHPNLIASDNIHPSPVGFGVYRQQWADAMLQEVYK
ncbi:MAG TPA: SGNH/GDSL hydrolase family protein, partial [Ktedonobacteraceae bacterium]|nr:SGNH/GDSL hydrolase family protein [Ktedonobacteraceae bacterium]